MTSKVSAYYLGRSPRSRALKTTRRYVGIMRKALVNERIHELRQLPDEPLDRYVYSIALAAPRPVAI